jgi:hypothetical protein
MLLWLLLINLCPHEKSAFLLAPTQMSVGFAFGSIPHARFHLTASLVVKLRVPVSILPTSGCATFSFSANITCVQPFFSLNALIRASMEFCIALSLML